MKRIQRWLPWTNRMWVRLSLNYGLIVLLAVLLLTITSAVLVNTSVRSFLITDHMEGPGSLTEQLADYYTIHPDWQGVDALFTAALTFAPVPRNDFHLTLVDAAGSPIYSSLDGGAAPAEEVRWASEYPVQVGGETVATVEMFILPPSAGDNPREQDFLGIVSQGLLFAALIGGILGVIFGVTSGRRLAAPLSALQKAARSIGNRNLNVRVAVDGSEEMMAVADSFNQMAADLEMADVQRQNLLADVAHELRTPLTVLQGSLRAILDDVYTLDKSEVARLYDQTRHLHQLVDDLHELAQAEARRLPLQQKSTDLVQLVENAAELFDPLAEMQEITLRADLPAQPVLAFVDPARIMQVVQNLTTNALRHTPAGGTITLAVTSTPAAAILRITDSGDGISVEHLPHIFDRFYRTDKARDRDRGGAGLGLAIVRALVELHGGTVAVTSPGPGAGTTFTVHLPTA